ncbi:MAG TPA: 5-oxoprolinase subunit PxpA [Oculatellaceae cyanobacterium]
MRRTRQNRGRGGRDANQGLHNAPQQASAQRVFINHPIDLNTNLGEGFGPYSVQGESDILPFVTSANIACGAHAGDPSHIEAALVEVKYYGLALGAHIGYPDLQGFGRREIHLTPAELRASILFQLGSLSGLARTFGFEFTQVRPHGFLYRQIWHDIRTATIVAKAISEYDRWLVFVGPACPNLVAAGDKAGIRVAGEAWIDKTYDANGHLLSHGHSRAVLKSQQEILAQAAQLINYGEVTALDGTRVPIDYQTIHLHPHMSNAKAIAEQVRSMIGDARALTTEPFSVGVTEPPEMAYGFS